MIPHTQDLLSHSCTTRIINGEDAAAVPMKGTLQRHLWDSYGSSNNAKREQAWHHLLLIPRARRKTSHDGSPVCHVKFSFPRRNYFADSLCFESMGGVRFFFLVMIIGGMTIILVHLPFVPNSNFNSDCVVLEL